jgi:ketosteroid isomerase-like protein
MEQSEAVGVVRANSAAFSRMDVEAMMEHYAPDAVVVDRRGSAWARSPATTSCGRTT